MYPFTKIRFAFLIFFLIILSSDILKAAEPAVADKVEENPLKVIVIDPGHGGKDSGARGPGGTFEKDLTLAISLKLAEKLRDSIEAEVLLTRNTDEYITLKERTVFANFHKADIFVSVHINAARRKKAHGVEVYFLNFEASDDDARKAAAFENNVINLDEAAAEVAPKDDIESILWDLTQSEAHSESSKLAEAIYLKLFKAAGGENRGVKQAPFIVLTGATMPAVLIEAGFISNPKEEKRLITEKVQAKIANAIKTGVLDFSGKMNGRAIDNKAKVARNREAK